SHVVVAALERAANQGAFHCHDRQRPTSSNRRVELGVMYSMGAPALSSSTLCLWPWYPSRAAIWSLIGPSSSVYGRQISAPINWRSRCPFARDRPAYHSDS